MKKNRWMIYFIFGFCLMDISFAFNAFDEFIVKSKRSLEGINEYNHSQYKDCLEQLNYIRKSYDKCAELFESESPGYSEKLEESKRIPKVLHFIWIGPKDFPKKSLNNILKWKEMHPDYKIYFWTDRLRSFPDHILCKIKIKSISIFSNEKLMSLYKKSSNYGEKSDLIRYTILDKIGGVYIDHDVTPLKSISFLIERFSFFCTMEGIWPMVNQGYIKISNAFIGAVKGSAIIQKTIEDIEKEWETLTHKLENLNIWSYSLQQNNVSESKEFEILSKILVLSRTFLPFTNAVKSIDLDESQLILPPQYGSFDRKSKFFLIDHSFDGAWTIPSEPKNIELKNRRKINKALKKCNGNYIGLVFLSLSLLTLLLLIRRKIFL